MDLTFLTAEGILNIRASAVFYRDGRLLAKRKVLPDGSKPVQYSLPGGRVRLHETAEQAIVRETQEELGIAARILRPLWVCQNFYTESVHHTRCHELCFYFWMDASGCGRFAGRPACAGVYKAKSSEFIRRICTGHGWPITAAQTGRSGRPGFKIPKKPESGLFHSPIFHITCIIRNISIRKTGPSSRPLPPFLAARLCGPCKQRPPQGALLSSFLYL